MKIVDRKQELVKKFVQWSKRESSQAGNASIDPASVDATKQVGNFPLCMEVEELPTFEEPSRLLSGYCSCMSARSCQGVTPSVDKYMANVANNMRDKKVTVIQDGHVHTQLRGLLKGRVLFDTGAIDRSYISKTMVDHHRDALQPYIRQCADVVTMADGVATQHIEELLIAPVLFKDSQGRAYEATIQLYVMPLGFDLVIGLPDIRLHFAALLMDMILDGHQRLGLVDGKWISKPRKRSTKQRRTHIEAHADPGETPSQFLTSVVHIDYLEPRGPDLIDAWTDYDATAPEEAELPEAVQFRDVLEAPETTEERDALIEEYEKALPDRISDEMLECTDVLRMMKRKGSAVFVNDLNTWTGLQIPPVELNWMDELFEGYRSRQKARNVRVELLANAKTEFDRLRRYIYEKSTSPVTSPIVIAPKATKPFIRFCGDYTHVNKMLTVHHGYILKIEDIIKKEK